MLDVSQMPTAAKVKEIDLLINELRPFFV